MHLHRVDTMRRQHGDIIRMTLDVPASLVSELLDIESIHNFSDHLSDNDIEQIARAAAGANA